MPFCIRKNCRIEPRFFILPPTEPPSLLQALSDSVAYWIPGALIAASLFLGIGIILVPHTAGAFWPFSILRASEVVQNAPVLHDSSLALLEAAVNIDPSPTPSGSDLSVSEGSALMATAGVDGTLTEVDHTSSSGNISTYVVQDGDSISVIASSHGVSVDTILWANGLTRKSAIKPGMTLVILPVSGVRHTVKKGETLAGIAKSFSADKEDIAAYNGLDSGVGLIAGSELIIPGGEAPATVVKKSTNTKTATRIKTGGSMGAVIAVGDTSRSSSFSNPVPAGRLTQRIHGWNGVDIAAPSGSPVLAAAAGTVIVSRVGGWNGGYGTYVVIDHGDGTQTLYAHNSTNTVSVGQKVTKGQNIGTVGNTGNSTGNHLHFEVRGAKNPFANS